MLSSKQWNPFTWTSWIRIVDGCFWLWSNHGCLGARTLNRLDNRCYWYWLNHGRHRCGLFATARLLTGFRCWFFARFCLWFLTGFSGWFFTRFCFWFCARFRLWFRARFCLWFRARLCRWFRTLARQGPEFTLNVLFFELFEILHGQNKVKTLPA